MSTIIRYSFCSQWQSQQNVNNYMIKSFAHSGGVNKVNYVNDVNNHMMKLLLTVAESTMSQQAASTFPRPTFKLSSRLSTWKIHLTHSSRLSTWPVTMQALKCPYLSLDAFKALPCRTYSKYWQCYCEIPIKDGKGFNKLPKHFFCEIVREEDHEGGNLINDGKSFNKFSSVNGRHIMRVSSWIN